MKSKAGTRCFLKTGILLCLALFALNASGLGITVQKNEFEKGEKMVFLLECLPEKNELFLAKQENKIVFEKEFQCPENGSFEFSFQSSFLDPAGTWKLLLSEEEQSSSMQLTVKEPREAGFLLVRLLSPAQKTFYRGQKIIISVQVKDEGKTAQDANLVFWGIDGKKRFIEKNSQGNYVFEYQTGLGDTTGKWDLEILALKKNQNQFIGGKIKQAIEILPALIEIQILSPNVFSIEASEKLEFLVSGKYFDKNSVEFGQANVVFGVKEFELQNKENGNFAQTIDLAGIPVGTVKARIQLMDVFGNNALLEHDFLITCTVTCLLKSYGVMAVVLSVIIALAIRIGVRLTGRKKELKKLEEEKTKTTELIKNLQTEYFSKGIIPVSSYKKNLSEYMAKLSELEKKIELLKKSKNG